MHQSQRTGFSLATYDWISVHADLDAKGWAILPHLLKTNTCNALIACYEDDTIFRNRIVMARHGYGRGEYRYFSYPLPSVVSALRSSAYPRLVTLANRWNECMKIDARFPENHDEFIARCHGAGQLRPTPLLLRYGKDDYNCLHQDLYGEHLFPLQLAALLNAPGKDFEGGEFVVTEQRPRMQSRATVIPLQQGDGLVFAVNYRPVTGARGFYRQKMRHGVSTVRSGHRHTLGIIFHDSQ